MLAEASKEEAAVLSVLFFLPRYGYVVPGTADCCLLDLSCQRCVGSPNAKHLPAGHHPAGCHGTAVLCFLNSDRSCTVDLKAPAQFRNFLGCQDTVTVMEA